MDLTHHLTQLQKAFIEGDSHAARRAAFDFLDRLALVQEAPAIENFENTVLEILGSMVEDFQSYGLEISDIMEGLVRIAKQSVGVVQQAAIRNLTYFVYNHDKKYADSAKAELAGLVREENWARSNPEAAVSIYRGMLEYKAGNQVGIDIAIKNLLIIAGREDVIEHHSSVALAAISAAAKKAPPETHPQIYTAALNLALHPKLAAKCKIEAFSIAGYSTNDIEADTAFAGIKDCAGFDPEKAVEVLQILAAKAQINPPAVRKRAITTLLDLGSGFGFYDRYPEHAASALATVVYNGGDRHSFNARKAFCSIAAIHPEPVLKIFRGMLLTGGEIMFYMIQDMIRDIARTQFAAIMQNLRGMYMTEEFAQWHDKIADEIMVISVEPKLMKQSPQDAVDALTVLLRKEAHTFPAGQKLFIIAGNRELRATRPDIVLAVLDAIEQVAKDDPLTKSRVQQLRKDLPATQDMPQRPRVIGKLAETHRRWQQQKASR